MHDILNAIQKYNNSKENFGNTLNTDIIDESLDSDTINESPDADIIDKPLSADDMYEVIAKIKEGMGKEKCEVISNNFKNSLKNNNGFIHTMIQGLCNDSEERMSQIILVTIDNLDNPDGCEIITSLKAIAMKLNNLLENNKYIDVKDTIEYRTLFITLLKLYHLYLIEGLHKKITYYNKRICELETKQNITISHYIPLAW